MKDFDVRKLIRPDILGLPGYVPITPTDVLARRLGIAPERVLKLDGNENPFGPSPRALEAIRRESEMGTVEPGKLANLLVLAADPLADISHLRTTLFTVKRGRRFDRAGFRPIARDEIRDED